ncbi:hypothetical protein HMPREF1624_06040 [Sporothrix schenckii ATCC 58251]|uniref:DNA replication ATP-dependent helicase/nuclease n=1 Tax=Sporothrix schenckii (strain ATCC 58251 / de Perez 2211183) TaxID=1391915 RepID=U7PSZ7_SPOS1|nr:hypothetical protein HMPREF1624_06040 [Sporothrix schenckii ATCC 58251]
MAPATASKKASQKTGQRDSQRDSRKGSQPRQASQTKPSSIRPGDAASIATSAPPHLDKENDIAKDDKDATTNGATASATGDLPSTQPSNITPTVAATPEFLSIHVRTPRARFAWQELVGTPDTPKIRESLGISPDAKLSWVTGQNHDPSPVAAAVAAAKQKQGTKRPRSCSPPSSPTNSRSKRVAENVQKFKEVMASATAANLALEDRFPRKHNGLARHRTEVGRSTVRSLAPGADSSGIGLERQANLPAANGPSPRTAAGLRRSMSCNTTLTTPTTKRRKTDGNDLVAAPSPHETIPQPRQPSVPQESRPLSRQQASAPPPSSRQEETLVEDELADQVDTVDMVDAEPPVRPASPVSLHRLSLTVNNKSFREKDPSIPDTESNGKPATTEPTETTDATEMTKMTETKTKDHVSDYGDDVFDDFDDLDDNLFDDDMLAEIDASLAPPKRSDTETNVVAARMADAGAEDEFGDLGDGLDDDVFTAVTAAENSTTKKNQQQQPIDLTSSIPRADDTVDTNAAYTKPAPAAAPAAQPGVADMEDMFGGDDFGEDFDFEAAELAATQAASRAGPASTAVTPWANTQSSSHKRKAIQRYLVTNVLISSYHDERERLCQEKILVVQADGDRSGSMRAVHLRGDWFDTPAAVKAYVHVLGEFDATGMCVVDNDHGMLILHPDQLVSATNVAESFDCTRRAVLKDRVKSASDASPPLVYGTLLHEIFQEALMSNQWTGPFVRTTIDSAIQKHLEDLYIVKLDVPTAREYLLTRTRELQCWAELFVAPKPKPGANAAGRNGEKVNMCVSKLLDVEEHVWSPMYGLKGNIDATVQVTMNVGSDSKTLTVPFELKTGRNATAAHQAQTVLYNLLLSDRYDIEIVYGILYYTENSQMMRIPAIRNELRHMIMKRNELACHTRESSVQLPDMLRNRNACGRCFAQTSCFVYHKLADEGTAETSGMGDKFNEIVGHLTPKHRDFFLKWDDLLTKEEMVGLKVRRELWTMVSAEREKLGRCFADVIIEQGSAYEEAGTSKVNRFHYTLVKEHPTPGFSFMDSQLAVGDPIVVSDEDGHFALAIGFVMAIRKQRMDVAVDRRLHNARIREDGFNEKTNQVFAGIMEAGAGPRKRIGIEENYGGRSRLGDDHNGSHNAHAVRYRVDKDEFSQGMSTVRNNIVQIMAGHRVGLREIRQLVVDLVPPRFKAAPTQYVLDDGDGTDALNVDQKRAIAKVMSAQDYALVLGMPGTGKTTTIAHIIRALVSQGKSVLLTSYTHTAVDNILLKLRHAQTPILRLGAPSKVHPDVRDFAILAAEPKASLEDIRAAWHDTPIVATSCLGIGHALFNERMFDYCIVDEASQITLPICLGPIRMARTFVLVGDHNQLPPLVQNEEARVGGLDISLFKLLSDTHPDSVVNLEHQYRMSEDIMALSNTLIYQGRLKCGTEALRTRTLHVPDMARLHQHHHNARSMARLTPGSSFCTIGGSSAACWLRDLVRPETRVAFVNTDSIDGSREEAKGNRIVNPCEARLVTQLVEALLTVGIPASEIGVMTHYRSQLALLKHQLRGVKARGSDIEMHTADRFQGRDKEVIVLSLVRSNESCSIGDLLKDWRRVNVAFTRAKTKLLVVGSRSTLQGTGRVERDKKDKKERMDRDLHNGETGEEMLARFVRLMEERRWIYDLPADALDNHLFEELPATQAASASLDASLGAEKGMMGYGGGARFPGKDDNYIQTTRSMPPHPVARIQAQKPFKKVGPATAKSPSRQGIVPSAGKENARPGLLQPGKRVGRDKEALLKGRPVLQGILNDMMGGKHPT